MSIKNVVSDITDAYLHSGHKPKQINPQLYQLLQDHMAEGKMLRVRPYPENNGIYAAEEVLMAMHNIQRKWFILNTSEPLTFEIWFNEGTIQFLFHVDGEREERKLRKQIDGHYPNAEIVEMDDMFPEIYQGDWVAGSEMKLKQNQYYPIRNIDGVKDFISGDPYRSILSDMLNSEQDRIIVQAVFKPALGTWTRGGPLGYINPLAPDIEEVAESLRQEQLVPGMQNKTRKPTSEERQLAETIAQQDGKLAYHLNLRILALAPNEKDAKSNAWSVARTFEQSYQETGDQRFVQEAESGIELNDLLKRTAGRKLVDNDVILTIPELAGVAHLPNENVETPAIDWNQTKAGARIPASAERFGESETQRFEESAEAGGQPPDHQAPPDPTADQSSAPDPQESPYADTSPPSDPASTPPQSQPTPDSTPAQPPADQDPSSTQPVEEPIDDSPYPTTDDGLISKLAALFGFESDRGLQPDATELPSRDETQSASANAEAASNHTATNQSQQPHSQPSSPPQSSPASHDQPVDPASPQDPQLDGQRETTPSTETMNQDPQPQHRPEQSSSVDPVDASDDPLESDDTTTTDADTDEEVDDDVWEFEPDEQVDESSQ